MTTNTLPGLASTPDVVRLTGATPRQLIYWVARGYICPAVPPAGPGSQTGWSREDIEKIRRVLARIRWGLTVDAAWRDTDPCPCPPAPLP